MLMEVIAGLLTSALSAGTALAWRHRGRLGIARSRTVRVSFCALLRVRDDDRTRAEQVAHDTETPQGSIFLVRLD